MYRFRKKKKKNRKENDNIYTFNCLGLQVSSETPLIHHRTEQLCSERGFYVVIHLEDNLE